MFKVMNESIRLVVITNANKVNLVFFCSLLQLKDHYAGGLKFNFQDQSQDLEVLLCLFRRSSVKMVFLKILQISQDSRCVGDFF